MRGTLYKRHNLAQIPSVDNMRGNSERRNGAASGGSNYNGGGGGGGRSHKRRRVGSSGRSRRSHGHRQRKHYDSSSDSGSSESSGTESDSSGGGYRRGGGHRSRHEDKDFAKYERKRWKTELASIQPINGMDGTAGQGCSAREKTNDKDALRADAMPVGVDTSTTWESVGGLQSHVESLKEMVMLPMLYPEIFQQFDVQAPKGVLFYGPPGCGKTLVARALASTCSQHSAQPVAFFMRKGADCLSKWVGEAERQLRLLFEQAKRHQVNQFLDKGVLRNGLLIRSI